MRTMMKVSLPVAASNRAIKDGSLPNVIQATMESLKPEAAYFYTENGKRSFHCVFNLKEPSDIPVIAERFFFALEADVTFIPVMNADDLKKGLDQVMRTMAMA